MGEEKKESQGGYDLLSALISLWLLKIAIMAIGSVLVAVIVGLLLVLAVFLNWIFSLG